MLYFMLGFLMFLPDGKTKRPLLENSLGVMTFPRPAVTAFIFFPVNTTLANE